MSVLHCYRFFCAALFFSWSLDAACLPMTRLHCPGAASTISHGTMQGRRCWKRPPQGRRIWRKINSLSFACFPYFSLSIFSFLEGDKEFWSTTLRFFEEALSCLLLCFISSSGAFHGFLLRPFVFYSLEGFSFFLCHFIGPWEG
jgi:hypothetical protein